MDTLPYEYHDGAAIIATLDPIVLEESSLSSYPCFVFVFIISNATNFVINLA